VLGGHRGLRGMIAHSHVGSADRISDMTSGRMRICAHGADVETDLRVKLCTALSRVRKGASIWRCEAERRER
jgi:hypothetical protein